MSRKKFLVSLFVFALLAFGIFIVANVAKAAAAAAPKGYQVTGPILEVTDTMIAVQKGKDRWELGRDASTKVTGDLKVGSTVTVFYKMTATSAEVKAAKPAASPKKP